MLGQSYFVSRLVRVGTSWVAEEVFNCSEDDAKIIGIAAGTLAGIFTSVVTVDPYGGSATIGHTARDVVADRALDLK